MSVGAPQTPKVRIFPLNTSGKPITLRPGFLAVCAVIRNGTTGAILLTDATGGAHAVAAGTTQTVYFPSSDVLTAQSIAGATGDGEIQLSDSYLPTNQNPSQQQPPGTVTSNDATAQQLLTDIQLLLGTTNANTGNTNSNVASLATLITATNALDTDIRAYLAALQGMLAQGLTAFVFTGVWQEQTIGPLATGRQQLSFSVKRGTVDGTVWVAYSIGGTRTYLENRTYWGRLQPMMQPIVPLWIVVTEYIPAGATVIVGSDAACTVTVKL